MQTVTQHLREHALSQAGFFTRRPRPDLDELRKTQWNQDFEDLMRNRLVMGAFRYGTFTEQTTRRYNNIRAIAAHLRTYADTGNGEHLVDIANIALVEFTKPFHAKFHFASIDDGVHVTKEKD